MPSLKVICPKCRKGQQIVGDIPSGGMERVCVFCKATFKIRPPAQAGADDLPAAREAVPRPSDLPVARESVPRPSDLPVSRESVPRPGDLPVSRESSPRPSDLPVSRESSPRPSNLPVSRESVPRPGDLPVSRESVPRPGDLPVAKEKSFGPNLPTSASERVPSKTPPLGLALELSLNMPPGSTDDFGTFNLGPPPGPPPGAPPMPTMERKGPPSLRTPPPNLRTPPPSLGTPPPSLGTPPPNPRTPPPVPRRSNAPAPLPPLRIDEAASPEPPPAAPAPKPMSPLAPLAPSSGEFSLDFSDEPSAAPAAETSSPVATVAKRPQDKAETGGNMDLGFSLELEGNLSAAESGREAIPFPGARVASEGLAEASAAGANDVPTLAPPTGRGSAPSRALRPTAHRPNIPRWALYAGGAGVVAVVAALVLVPVLHSAPSPESVIKPFLPALTKDTPAAYQEAADQLAKSGALFKKKSAKLYLRASEVLLTGLTVHGEDSAKLAHAEEMLNGVPPDAKLVAAIGRARALLAVAKGKPRDVDKLLTERNSPESQLIVGLARLKESKDALAVSSLRAYVAAKPGEALGHFLLGKALLGSAGAEASKEWRATLAINPAHFGAQVGLARLEETPEKRLAAARALLDKKPSPGSAGTAALADLQLLLGQSAQALGRTPEATDAFQRAIAFDRRLIPAHLALGESLLSEGNYAQALERLRGAGPRLEETTAGKFALGGALVATGDAEQGLVLVNAAAKEQPENPRGPFWIGFAATTKQPPDLAAGEAGYRDAIKRDPKFLPASLRLAALLRQQAKAEDSLAVLRAAEEAGAPPSVLQLAWGEALIVAKEPSKAEEVFRKALAADPTSISARLGVASALEAQGNWTGSKEVLEGTLKSSPATLGLRQRLALVCLRLGQKTEALSRYQEEVQAGHATPALRLALADLALELGKLELAQSETKQVLDENPRSADAAFAMARLHEARNETGAALQEYRHATTWSKSPVYSLAYGRILSKVGKEGEALLVLEAASSLAEGRMERGRIYYRRGEMENALADFKAASDKTPDQAEPLILQGLCYDKMGQAAKAEEIWRAALRADPKAPEPHYRLGRMEMDRGKPAAAIDHFRKAATEVPDKAPWRTELYFQLAQAELLTGSKSAAVAAFKKYLELAPPDAPARPEATRQVARLDGAKK